MSYMINLGITDVDHEKKTLKVHGLKVSFNYFEEIVVTPILNSLKPSEAVDIMKQLAAAGMRWHIWADHAKYAHLTIQEEIERKAEAQREVEKNAERVASMMATPADIAKENADREARRLAAIQKSRKANPAALGF